MSQLPLGSQFMVPPGITAESNTFENQFWRSGWSENRRLAVIVSGTSRDSGNTSNTKLLRAGLAMGGPIYSGSTNPYKVKQWDPAATDGSQYFLGFLPYSLTMYDQLAADQDRFSDVMVGGYVYSDYVFAPGNTASGISGTYGNLLVASAQQRFLFDKNIKHILPNVPLPMIKLSDLSASPNTLTYDHAGRIFNNLGDVGARTVNLPAPAAGMGPFRFYRLAAQSLTLDAGSGNLIYAPADITKQTLVLSTVCAYVELMGVDATHYLLTDAGGTVTPT